MAALTAARLCNFITNALTFFSCSIHLWTDSHMSFTRSKNQHICYSLHFRIRKLTEPECWRYCSKLDNPADLLTRGTTSSQLKSSTLWNQGPQWLPSHTCWPTWQFSPTLQLQALAITASEFTPPTNQRLNTSGIHCVTETFNYSKLFKLLGVTAYTCRFTTNCRKQQEDRLTGPLTPSEPHNAQ